MNIDAGTWGWLALGAADLGGIGETWLAVLLDAAVKGAVLLGVAGAAVLAMRKASAATRQTIWLLALAALIALPIVSAALPGWQVLPEWVTLELAGSSGPADDTVPTAEHAEFPADGGAALSDDPLRPRDHIGLHAGAPIGPTDDGARLAPLPAAEAFADAPPTAPDADSPTGPPETERSWLVPLAAAVWLAGAAVCLLPLVLGRISLWRLARRADRVEAGTWASLARRAARAVGLRRRVALLRSDDEPMPMVWGTLRPKLLLPAGADDWTVERRWVVLLHELAHVRRRDCLAKLVAHVACSFYWFNPLCWIAFRLMQRESEAACDDLVLACCAGNSKTEIRMSKQTRDSKFEAGRPRPAGALSLGTSSFGMDSKFELRNRDSEVTIRPSDYARHLLEIAGGVSRRSAATSDLKTGMPASHLSRACRGAGSIAMARKSKLEGRLLAILDAGRNRRALTRIGVLLAAVVVAAVAIPLAMMGAAPSQPAATSANGPDGYVKVQIAIRDRQYAPGEELDSGRFKVLHEFTWPVPADGKAGKLRATSRDGTALDVAWSGVAPLPKREKGFVFENFVWSLPAPVVDPLNGDRRTFGPHRVARQAFTPAFSPLATPVGLGDAAHRTATAQTPALVIHARWAEHEDAPATQPAPERLLLGKLDLSDVRRTTRCDDLPDLWEENPPGSGSHAMRQDVEIVYAGLDGSVFYVPTKKVYYVQRDPAVSSTLTYYGPITGQLAERIKRLIASARSATRPATQPAAGAAETERLVEQLGSDELPEREAALEALLDIGAPALQALRGVLGGAGDWPYEQQQKLAATALTRIVPDPDPEGGPLRMTVVPNRESFLPTEGVYLSVVLSARRDTNVPIQSDWSNRHAGCMSLEVRGPAGPVQFEGPFGHPVSRPIHVNPANPRSRTYCLNYGYDLSAPGKYAVTVRLKDDRHGHDLTHEPVRFCVIKPDRTDVISRLDVPSEGSGSLRYELVRFAHGEERTCLLRCGGPLDKNGVARFILSRRIEAEGLDTATLAGRPVFAAHNVAYGFKLAVGDGDETLAVSIIQDDSGRPARWVRVACRPEKVTFAETGRKYAHLAVKDADGEVRRPSGGPAAGTAPATASQPAEEQPLTRPASAEELQAAVEKILRTRGRREDETWDRLTDLIEPGMTLKQVFAVFPPSVGALTFWHAPSSTYTYKTTLELSRTERWIEVKLSQAPQGLAKERVLARPRVARPRVKDGPEPLEDAPATESTARPAGVPQVVVVLDGKRMAALGVTAADVVSALSPLGAVDAATAESLGELAITRGDGGAVPLKDVAKIVRRRGRPFTADRAHGVVRRTAEGIEMVLPVAAATQPAILPEEAEEFAQLAAILNSGEFPDAREAAIAMAELRSPAAVDVLIEALPDASAQTAMGIGLALQEIGSPKAIPALMSMFDREDALQVLATNPMNETLASVAHWALIAISSPDKNAAARRRLGLAMTGGTPAVKDESSLKDVRGAWRTRLDRPVSQPADAPAAVIEATDDYPRAVARLKEPVRHGRGTQLHQLLGELHAQNRRLPDAQELAAIKFIADTQDIDARDRQGRSALHWAAWNAQPDVVRLLLARGADANAMADEGRTPLHDAADATMEMQNIRKRVPAVVELLLNAGADPFVDARPGRLHGLRPIEAVNGGGRSLVDIIRDMGGESTVSPEAAEVLRLLWQAMEPGRTAALDQARAVADAFLRSVAAGDADGVAAVTWDQDIERADRRKDWKRNAEIIRKLYAGNPARLTTILDQQIDRGMAAFRIVPPEGDDRWLLVVVGRFSDGEWRVVMAEEKPKEMTLFQPLEHLVGSHGKRLLLADHDDRRRAMPPASEASPTPERPATQPASAPASQSAPSTTSGPAGSKLEFRVAPAPSDVDKAELASCMDWLKAGRVGPWWDKELEWRGPLPSCMWLPVADPMPNAGNLVTGEYKGRKYVLVSDKPGQTMTPGEGDNAWGLEKVYATEGGSGRPAVGFEFDDRGAELFSAFTKANVGSAVAIIVDGEVVAAPKLMAALSRRGIIAGHFTIGDVRKLVRALRTGMPPAGESSAAPTTRPATESVTQPADDKMAVRQEDVEQVVAQLGDFDDQHLAETSTGMVVSMGNADAQAKIVTRLGRVRRLLESGDTILVYRQPCSKLVWCPRIFCTHFSLNQSASVDRGAPLFRRAV